MSGTRKLLLNTDAVCKVTNGANLANRSEQARPQVKVYQGSRRKTGPPPCRGPCSSPNYCHICSMNNHTTRERWFNGRNAVMHGRYSRYETAERMKQASSGLDSLKLSLTPDDVSLVKQFSDSLDKQREPGHPGIPTTGNISNMRNSKRNPSTNDPICLNAPLPHRNMLDINFLSKGLHLCNLSIRHILPKLDELRIVLASRNGPDIFCACETCLEPDILNNQIAVEGYDFLQKDTRLLKIKVAVM